MFGMNLKRHFALLLLGLSTKSSFQLGFYTRSIHMAGIDVDAGIEIDSRLVGEHLEGASNNVPPRCKMPMVPVPGPNANVGARQPVLPAPTEGLQRKNAFEFHPGSHFNKFMNLAKPVEESVAPRLCFFLGGSLVYFCFCLVQTVCFKFRAKV